MINPIYQIQIDDLTIRCAEIADAQAQKEAVESSIAHLKTFMTWIAFEPQTLEQRAERLKQWRADYLKDKDYAVVVFNGKKLVACAGLHNRLGNYALEIGYWVRADEVKKGIATKVSLALTMLAFDYIKVNRVEIHYNIANSISAKVAQKLNFQAFENIVLDDNTIHGRTFISKEMFEKQLPQYQKMYKKIQFFTKEEMAIVD